MESTRAKFTKSMRMTVPDEFKMALRTKPIGHGKFLSLHYHALSDPVGESIGIKLGLIVPKRLVRLAVQRNRVKRVLRESFRLKQRELPSGSYLFRLKRAPGALSGSEIKKLAREEADKLLRKVRMEKNHAVAVD